MQTQDPETYTAALRRLADERASGVLRTAAGDHTVVVRLLDGRTTGIGPLHGDATDLDDPVLRATLVQRLLERLVDGVVRETAAWSFDDDDDQALAPVPASLPAELSRRAVDAATALRRVGPDTVLRAVGAPGMGEAATVLHGSLDGTSTLAEVAEHVQRPLTAVAGLAVALVTSGRASLVSAAPPAAPVRIPAEPTPAAPTQTAPTQTAPTPAAPPPVEPTPTTRTAEVEVEAAAVAASAGTPTMADLATPTMEDEPAIDWSSVEDDDEPAMWVMAGDDAPADAPSAAGPSGSPTTSTLTSADVAGDDWADTSWLDELTTTSGRNGTQGPNAGRDAGSTGDAPATDRTDTRSSHDRDERASSAAEFAGLLGDLAGVDDAPAAPAPPAPSPTTPASAPATAPAPGDGTTDAPEPAATEPGSTVAAPGSTRRRRPRGDDVADFLRELSRLALEDES